MLFLYFAYKTICVQWCSLMKLPFQTLVTCNNLRENVSFKLQHLRENSELKLQHLSFQIIAYFDYSFVLADYNSKDIVQDLNRLLKRNNLNSASIGEETLDVCFVILCNLRSTIIRNRDCQCIFYTWGQVYLPKDNIG